MREYSKYMQVWVPRDNTWIKSIVYCRNENTPHQEYWDGIRWRKYENTIFFGERRESNKLEVLIALGSKAVE